jgi:diguanylate cyclase (GGDEF)-like protein
VELYARLRSADRALRFQRELIDLATTDSLTGTLNRRAFFEQAQQRCSHATDQDPLTVIMFDLDYFKRVNDTYGHDVGDQVLRTIGEVGRDHGGIIGRLGGEEFGLLLERSHLQAGIEHAEGLRAAVSELSFATPSGMLLVTCSFGVAQRQSHESVDQVLKRADIALYYAKKNGRNRVVAAEQRRVVTRDLEWSGLLRSLPRPEIGTDRAPDGSAKCRM